MDSATAWKNQVVDGLAITLSAFGLIALPIIVLMLGEAAVVIGLVAGTLWILVTTVVLFRHRLALGIRTGVMLVVLFSTMCSGLVVTGPLIAPTLSGAAAILLAELVLGRFVGAAALLFGVCLLLLLGLAISSGALPAPPADAPALHLGSSWIREATGFGMFGGLILVMTRFVVSRIEGSLRDTSAALARSQAEQEEKEAVRRELEVRDRQVAELQRLESLGRLAGGIAHDFNNSLTVLLGGVEHLSRGQLSAEDQQVLEDMNRSIDNSTQLTRQLLAYARKDTHAPEWVDLQSLLRSFVRSLERVLPDDVRLELNVVEMKRAFIDPAQIQHMLFNLVINARDAMPDGGKLVLSAKTGIQSGARTLLLSVADSGMGIPDDVRDVIFDPFFTTKPSGEGTGLGLSTVRSMVEGLKGTISVESVMGEGTEIQICIPLQESAETTNPERFSTRSMPVDATILVAEDQGLVRRTICTTLRGLGYKVLAADSEDEALLTIDAAPGASGEKCTQPGGIDLLCTDGIMPGTPSKVLIDTFQEKYPNAPVLVCSGYMEEDLVRRDIETGTVSFLAKPFTATALAERVSELLQGGRAASSR